MKLTSASGKGGSSPLREEDLRPNDLQRQQDRFSLNDIERLLSKKMQFVSIPCPACKSSDSVEEFRKYEFSFVRCKACKTMYVSPRPTPAILEETYAHSEMYAFWNKHIYPKSEDVRRTRIVKPRVARISDIIRTRGLGGGSLLEVGAGFGTFCSEMLSTNLLDRVLALEPTPELAETCRRRNLDTIEAPIERADIQDASIDIIVSFEVIEHVFSPDEFLTRCAQLLKPGGILILTCPNVEGFEISALKELSVSVDPWHLNYFNPGSISLLLAASGFTTVEILTPGKLDAEMVRKAILSGSRDISREPFLEYVLIDGWDRVGEAFQDFLADNLLSSHMWASAVREGLSNYPDARLEG